MLRASASRLSSTFLRRVTSNHCAAQVCRSSYYGYLSSGTEISKISPFCCFYSTGFFRFQSEDSDSRITLRDVCNSHSSPASEFQPQPNFQNSKTARDVNNFKIGENVSKNDKMNFLIKTLLDLKDSKEAVYGALDAWVAWEQDFPLVPLKKALVMLEKEEQWHRVIQVIKWMLGKGQGTTMGTYGQLIRALDKDRRAEEAHNIWVKKVGHDLHSVPWQLCHLMISIYYRNNMLERLVKLFKGLEAFDRKPPDKAIVQKVADACEMLGMSEDQKRILEKYKTLLTKPDIRSSKKSRKSSQKNKKKGCTTLPPS